MTPVLLLSAILDRPTTSMLIATLVLVVAGWLLHFRAEWATRAHPAAPTESTRPLPLDDGHLEPPAIVALLTNGYAVPRSAVTATALDLAARGWIRLSHVDGELVVITRGSATVGDTLRPFEQQVLNHLASRAFNDVSSVGTIAASHARLDRRWWLRFGRSVSSTANGMGLSLRRYTPIELAPQAAAAIIGAVTAWVSVRRGTDVALADSWLSRAIWCAVVVALIGLVWRTVDRAIGTAQKPTELGTRRSADWMGYRSRLRDRIPAHASVVAPPPQQLALAQAAVMGVAEHVLDEFPAAPEDHRAAWSEAGNEPHVVRVRYPVRPGYGQHPVKVAVVGLVVFFLARWLQGFLERVADGDALESLLERVPGQIDLIEKIADVLALVCWLPIAWAVWAVVAGLIDSVATRERVGVIVRARRPVEVVPHVLATVVRPFAERDRFSTYLAVDDGKRQVVTAWLASERTAAPQGAQARVRATPLLGYVRSSEPIGTATRSER